MKSLLFSIFIAFLSSQPLWSQNYHPFPDTNATWCDERYDNGWPVPNYIYSFYKTNGKCNINDTVYTIITDNYAQTRCFLREENKKVFCRISSEQPEFVIYDFDIVVGDTVLLPVYENGLFSTGYVEEADSILIGTEYHKRYFIECWDWHSMYIVEGVGSDLGLIYFDIPQTDIYGSLYCFSLDDVIYQTDNSGDSEEGNCWNYLGVRENSPLDINIYPNPATDYIYLDYQYGCRLELVDLTGRQCRQSLSNTIYVKDMEQGIYLLRVYSVTGTLLNQFKILKLNAL